MASVSGSPLLSEGLKAQLLNLAPPPDAVDNKTLKASAIKDVIAEHCATLPTRMSESLFDLLKPLISLCERHSSEAPGTPCVYS